MAAGFAGGFPAGFVPPPPPPVVGPGLAAHFNNLQNQLLQVTQKVNDLDDGPPKNKNILRERADDGTTVEKIQNLLELPGIHGWNGVRALSRLPAHLEGVPREYYRSLLEERRRQIDEANDYNNRLNAYYNGLGHAGAPS